VIRNCAAPYLVKTDVKPAGRVFPLARSETHLPVSGTSEANGCTVEEKVVTLVAIPGARTAVEDAAKYLYLKGPAYGSTLTGAAWVQELLNKHAARF
jgi:hypothetical protein